MNSGNSDITNEKKITIIDDDPDILEVLNITFGFAGFQVKTSTEGSEARKLALEFKPHAIILDVLLSGKDGRVICKALKKDNQTNHIPIIMISAHPDARNTVLEAGADGFLAKPFDLNELVELVNQQIKETSSSEN